LYEDLKQNTPSSGHHKKPNAGADHELRTGIVSASISAVPEIIAGNETSFLRGLAHFALKPSERAIRERSYGWPESPRRA
jgi:hypothetical protein